MKRLIDAAEAILENVRGRNPDVPHAIVTELAAALAEATAPATDEGRVVFGFVPAETQADGVPILILGLTDAARADLARGMQQTLDLTSIGLPLKLITTGGKDQATIRAALELFVRDSGAATHTMYGRDLAMKVPAHLSDENIEKAMAVFRETAAAIKASPIPGQRMSGCASLLQRKLGCRYDEARDIVNWLERDGWLSPADTVSARTILGE